MPNDQTIGRNLSVSLLCLNLCILGSPCILAIAEPTGYISLYSSLVNTPFFFNFTNISVI